MHFVAIGNKLVNNKLVNNKLINSTRLVKELGFDCVMIERVAFQDESGLRFNVCELLEAGAFGQFKVGGEDVAGAIERPNSGVVQRGHMLDR